MLKRKNKNKNERKMSRLFIVGSFLILIGITVIGIKIGYNYYLNKQEENAVNDFLEIKHEEEIPEETPTNEVVEEKKEETPTYNYIAVLEIPKINLKRGLLPINDKNNNVNKNVEVLKNSDMPNVKNGLLALAGHSGSSRIAFFNKLYKLNIKDLVYIYYNNIKYTYEVTSIDRQDKVGKIIVKRTKDTTELVLTTCDQQTKGKQIIVMAKLIEEIPY